MSYVEHNPPCQPGKIFLEGITTCVNHADFLAHTLPLNLRHFDRFVVVTAPEDKATQRVCDHYGAECYLTDEFQSRWGHFCKGAGINHGMSKLSRNGWILHTDCDCVLSPNFRKAIESADLDTSMIYGCDRIEFKSFTDWQRFMTKPEPFIQGAGFFIHTEHTGMRFGTRISFAHAGGYVPIGFLQLWHSDSAIAEYITGHSDAGREDSHFAAQWPRKKRGFLPEVMVYHLESEDAPMAVNWKGRTTKPFGID